MKNIGIIRRSKFTDKGNLLPVKQKTGDNPRSLSPCPSHKQSAGDKKRNRFIGCFFVDSETLRKFILGREMRQMRISAILQFTTQSF